MEKFYDRGRMHELRSLEELYMRNEFTFAVIYGRRRVGKSALIREFLRRGNKKAIMFTAAESTDNENLEDFSQSIYKMIHPELGSHGVFRSWDGAFEYIAEASKKEKAVVVIDEYPYLAKARPSISSELQRCMETTMAGTDIMLILCGSSMNFMENQVLGYQSPLYGRRTAQYKIEPLDYYDSAEFFGSAGAEDKLLGYAATGGIPQYLNVISRKGTVAEGIEDAFFDKSGFLHEEPYNLLKQELREPAVYNAIIGAIASGATKLNEIAGKVKEDMSKVSKYLGVLINLGIIKREVPMLSEKNAKGVYTICDDMYRFWYRFVRKETALIKKGAPNIFDEKVRPFIQDFMGPVFEEVCREYLWRLNIKKKLPFMFSDIGRWWGGNPITKTETEIDIVAASAAKKDMIIGECKWQKEKVGPEVYNGLKEKAVLFPEKNIRYFLFSKAGFKPDLKKEAERDNRLTLVTLNDLFSI